MEPNHSEDLPRIDEAINPIRAAIELVASGSAARVTVSGIRAPVIPAARLLARVAGVTLELISWSGGPVCDLVVTPRQTDR